MFSGIKVLWKKFGFENLQMEKSYLQFQKGTENSLLTFYNIINFIISLSLLLVSVFLQFPLRMIIARTIGVILLVVAYLIRNKSRNIQKIIVWYIMIQAMVTMLYNRENLVKKDKILGGFLTGNAFGIMEITLVLTYKGMKFRAFSFLTIQVTKMVLLSEELFYVFPTAFMDILVYVSFLSFYIFDDVLYRGIFKIIYESGDKLKKFQELLTYDLPSSLVIVNSAFDKVIYSNKFFQETFKEDGDEYLVSKESSIKVFSKFIIDSNSNLDDSFIERELSLVEYVRNYGSNIGNSQSQVISLLTTYKEDNIQFRYEVKLRKIVWEGEGCYAIVLHDISDKQVVIALKLANEEKDKLIATVSHELRTPINGTLGLLEIALRQTREPSLLSLLENMKSCSKLLLYLVNSILDLNQIRNKNLIINKDSFSLRDFVGEIKSLYSFNSQQKSLDFIIDVDTKVPENLYTDRNRLMEILVHLLGNAFKFTFQGAVTFRVSLYEDDPQRLVFCIEDTGIGIKEKDKTGLFRMFGQISHTDSNENTQGVGLGLTVSSELVKALNQDNDQRIELESEQGKGSKFWFKVDAIEQLADQSLFDEISIEDGKENLETPHLQELFSASPHKKILTYNQLQLISNKSRLKTFPTTPEDQPLSSDRKFISNSASKKHVLLVDDNPFNLMTAAFILDQLGYSSQKAFNGEEAIELLKQSQRIGERYCLILTDIQMPVLDGVEMSRIIQKKVEDREVYDVPIIAVTAKKLTRQDLVKYKENGILHAFEKPLLVEELRSVLNKMGLY